MKPESLVELAAGGDLETVSHAWTSVIEEGGTPLAELTGFRDVLTELSRAGHAAQAEELAWTALEMLTSRHPPEELLAVAGAFLGAVEGSEEVRAQVVGLYRSAYADFEGIDNLIEEAGLGGGRPVRRALRTLDVCLNLKEGDHLAARDDDGAARVDSIDPSTWQLSITTCDGRENLDAVRLADRYFPVPDTHFAVLRHFAPERLVKRLSSNLVDIVVDLCRGRNNKIDSDELEAILVPDLLTESDWKKWWTRARTALRKRSNFRISGRAPYKIEFDETPIALEAEMLEAFKRLRDPMDKHDLIDKYVRDCKLRGEQPSDAAVGTCADQLTRRAMELTRDGASEAGLFWMIVRSVAEQVGAEPPRESGEYLRTAGDLRVVFKHIESPALLDLACTALVEARPEDWQDQLLELLPILPSAVCDRVSERLLENGRDASDFEPIIEQIMASSVDHFDALLWLWDGPTQADRIPCPAAVTILTRIFRTLDECRRNDGIPREKSKKIVARARAVLSARKHERFDSCVDGMDPGMGSALRTELRRLHNLGRAVQVDLVNHLDRRCPPVRTGKWIDLWTLEDVLYVTQAGLARKQDEIEHHVNVKMKENAEAIGRAAEHGDLSENSEYKFALEERDLLRARLAQMNSQVAASRVISVRDVPTDYAGIGTKVTFKSEADGIPYELTFVGPWEADPEKNWLNYKAPLAAKVLGRHVGEIVEFDHSGARGRYEIVGFENGLSAGE